MESGESGIEVTTGEEPRYPLNAAGQMGRVVPGSGPLNAGSLLSQVSGKRALLYHSDGSFQAANLEANLVSTGLFTEPDIDILPMSATPADLSTLSGYDCVVVWTNFAPPNPVAQGDRLKEYVLAGGRVVLATYGYTSPENPWEMQGGIMEDGYNPLDLTSSPQTVFPRSLDFTSAATSHFILAGVSDFTYGGNGNYTDLTLDPGATLVGKDDHAIPLIAINGAANVIGINLYPGGAFPLSAGVYRAFGNACAGENNSAPTGDAGGPYTGTEGSAAVFDGTGSADPDGDALTYDWDFGDGSPHGTGETPSHTYQDNGSYTVTLVLSDGVASSTVTTTATIANAAPTVTELEGPAGPVAVNGGVMITASFTDAGVLDGHTAVIDWDDGTTSTADVNEVGGSGAASGSHSYTAAGVYTPSVTVTDKDGESGTSSLQFVVVYDPNGGFVTGGGWITSPGGAYSLDPSLAGKASFGFVSKYQKGATVPAGNTQFQFHAAGLEFHSTAYDWLVIAGARAQYKGVGKIANAGDYGFLLTSLDGQLNGGGPDRFRLKIWDRATGAVLYDNQLGDADDASPSTALGGGSIVIHKK